ncbi:MAG: hypothetical protein IJL92_00210 [Thermoguttaceae bacterium]|nr:hypothetical protein [Thermoguttaceae bacterium]
MSNAAINDHDDKVAVLSSKAVSQEKDSCEPFALFEEYMFRDSIPEYPMDLVFQLRFNGLLDWTKVLQTLSTLFSRHVLLQRRAVSRFGRLFWAPVDQLPEVKRVDYDEHPEILNETGFPNLHRIDLGTEPGLHVCYIESRRESWSRLVFHFHHSVADGIGVIRLINEWLIFYSNATCASSRAIEAPEINPEAFRERRRIGWGVRAYFRHFFDTWRSTRMFVLHFPRALVRVVPPVRKLGMEKGYPHLLTMRMTHEETSDYVHRTRERGVTVNDELLTDFFLTMDKWLTDVRHDQKNGLLRVMAPINLRTERHLKASISNVVSAVFIDRTRRKIKKGKENLLQSVAKEMLWVKKTGQRYWFLLLLNTLHNMPGLLRLTLRIPLCRSTGVFSNLGRVLEDSPLKRDEQGRLMLGDVVLEHIDGKASLRHKTALSAVTLTYAGELSLCVCYDSRLISKEEARRFNEIFRSYLHQS